MNKNQSIIRCFVTNDLNQDQRMHRICTTMAAMNHKVILTGRLKPDSLPLMDMPFQQKRIYCFFNQGVLFYAAYNIRIFWLLMVSPVDLIYSVDTDTLLACTLAAKLRRKKLLFDSHEYFVEVPELEKSPIKRAIWQKIEQWCVPFTDLCYTVNESLSNLFTKQFKKTFISIYNVPFRSLEAKTGRSEEKILLYQGVLNQGRGLEDIITAMPRIEGVKLIIAGTGDIEHKLRTMAESSPAKDRIVFIGWQSPKALRHLAAQATLGLNLLHRGSLSYYYSLANKFFDYMQAGLPSLNMDFPEYRNMIEKYDNGYLLDTLSPDNLVTCIHEILNDKNTLNQKRINSLKAAKTLHWENEASKIQTSITDLLNT